MAVWGPGGGQTEAEEAKPVRTSREAWGQERARKGLVVPWGQTGGDGDLPCPSFSFDPSAEQLILLPGGLPPWCLSFFSVLSAKPRMPLNQERTMLSPCPIESLGVTSLSALLLPAPLGSVNVSFMKRGHLISVSARLKTASSALSSWLAISNRGRKQPNR